MGGIVFLSNNKNDEINFMELDIKYLNNVV